MASFIVPLKSVFPGRPAETACPDNGIRVNVRIEAEIRRVLYALATPEYMEAWLQLPESDRVECSARRRSYDKFRIDSYWMGRKQESIYGRYQLSRPGRVTYLFERASGSGQCSVAEIRLLLAGTSNCMLQLKHGFFSDGEEVAWFAEMWHKSIPKLQALVEGIGYNSARNGIHPQFV